MESELEPLKRQKLALLADAQEALDEANKFYEEKKADAKDAKEAVAACQDHVNSIVKDLRDLERGVYQQELPFETPASDPQIEIELNGKTVSTTLGRMKTVAASLKS